MKISVLVALKVLLRGARASALVFVFSSPSALCLAQSLDISAPSPVRASEVVGTITARDLGDSRLTDHFYAFIGRPGDVLITVESHNLNGDVDLFTAGSLRPLLKITIYAESSSPVTRSIFLRKREDLILRVEARTPNDDEGTYRIRLGGTFEPLVGDDLQADTPAPTPETPTVSPGSRRVSSVGARIAEPPVVPDEVAAAPTPQPTPEEVAVPTETAEPSPTTETPGSTSTPEPTPRRSRGRVPPGRRRPASQPAKKSEPSIAEKTNEERTAEVTVPESPAPTSRRTGRRGATSRRAEPTPAQDLKIGPRLVIEMHDGTRIERFMSTIRRVTVENNQIVVVRKDGQIERTRMNEVLRMAIEP